MMCCLLVVSRPTTYVDVSSFGKTMLPEVLSERFTSRLLCWEELLKWGDHF